MRIWNRKLVITYKSNILHKKSKNKDKFRLLKCIPCSWYACVNYVYPKNCFFSNFKHLQKRVFKFIEMFRSIFHATLIQIMTSKEGTIFKYHVRSLSTCHYHPAKMSNSNSPIICNNFTWNKMWKSWSSDHYYSTTMIKVWNLLVSCILKNMSDSTCGLECNIICKTE